VSAENSSSFDLLACSNVNSAWGALVMEVLARLGVETVVISPGSRSTPLALAASRNPKLDAIPILDERTAGFFALGLAKRTHKPVMLVCTSGSAVVNYYPAVLEASMSGTPLIVLTADRPAELSDCSAGQTIDQTKVFGRLVRFFHEVSLPEVEPGLLAYLRQTLVHAVQRSLHGNPGPVHLNFPFREPLSPYSEHSPVIDASSMESAATVMMRLCEAVSAEVHLDSVALERLASHQDGLIVVGAVNPSGGNESFAEATAAISRKLGWPILSDILNPLRGYRDKYQSLVCNYDRLLRNGEVAEMLKPAAILQIGPLPTSKILRGWLANLNAVSFLLSERPVNIDPLHRIAIPLSGTVEALANSISQQEVDMKWLGCWEDLDREITSALKDQFEQTDGLFEGKIAWLLSRYLPKGTPTFIANSMSVRYAEYFWCASDRQYPIYCNRGTNGIDGTLGTAMGVAHRGHPAVLLTGDLAFLHDTNALLTAGELKGSLTVVLANNKGGGIFEHLPVSRIKGSFERYFATPQTVQMDTLCQAYGVAHQRIKDWDDLVEAIRVLPKQGVRLLEVSTDRKADQAQLREFMNLSRD
jgi:2-succinyl-5-enolpyruvyl-6-hydroxy-3-cyclohexene-1-carboxylate synthase